MAKQSEKTSDKDQKVETQEDGSPVYIKARIFIKYKQRNKNNWSNLMTKIRKKLD